MKNTIIKDSVILVTDTITKIQHVINLNTAGDNSSQLVTNIVTILIGLIAGIIALYQVKSNIISSARISWIENLRDSISAYCVEVGNCAVILTNMFNETKGKPLDEITKIISRHYPLYSESTNKSSRLGNKIVLYLNSDEINHKTIEELIDKISEHLHKKPLAELDKDQLEKNVNEIIKVSKIIFKTEWDKSKKVFRI